MHKPVENSSKDAVQIAPQLWMSGTVEMWITVAAGPLPGSRPFPPRPVPGRSAAGRLAVRASAAAARDKHAQGVHGPERAAPAGQTGCPSRRRGAIASQLMPEYLQPPDSGRHP